MRPKSNQIDATGTSALTGAADSVITHGSRDFLQQAHRNNWRRYLDQLSASQPAGSRAGTMRGWDACILTASDERQAAMVERQLAHRRQAGLLPSTTRFFVVADPGGTRIGSGGATLRILAALYNRPHANAAHPAAHSHPHLAPLAELDASRQRVLIIHSGGDSRRLPHCSATGKLFARIPRELPDGRASTIFDEFLINLSGVATNLPSGVLLVSGDTLIIFDHLQLSLRRRGATGISVAVSAAVGARHGVYVSAPERASAPAPDHQPQKRSGGHTVHRFLHKVSVNELAAAGAIDAEGTVQLDTGLVWFDVAGAQQLAELVDVPEVAALCAVGGAIGETGDHAQADTPLNLYGDLLMPLAAAAQREEYLGDTSDGPATPGLQAARARIWSHLRGLPFSVERLQPAVFVHFGTSEEYWRMVSRDQDLAVTCNWTRRSAAWVGAWQGEDTAVPVLVNAMLAPPPTSTAALTPPDRQQSAAAPLLITDSRLPRPPQCAGRSIIAGVHTKHPLTLHTGSVLHQLPLQGGYVTRLLGIDDHPKLVYTDAKATFLNRPWADLLAALDLSPQEIWPHVDESQRTLWTARLYPRHQDREESLRLTLGLQDPKQTGAAWQTAWRTADRLSLAESFEQADGDRLLQEISALEDEIAAATLLANIDNGMSATDLAARVRVWAGPLRRNRLELLTGWLTNQSPLMQIRGYATLAAIHRNTRLEDKAFRILAHMIEADTRQRLSGLIQQSHAASSTPRQVRVEAAARIDFGGGWTDTPPYSLEAGGRVFNAAITLHDRHPVIVETAWLNTPQIMLDSHDIDEVIELQTAGDVLAYDSPADPFALLKAALVMQGIVPPDTAAHVPLATVLHKTSAGRGLRISTQTTIPRGSGLGTSSILAGAILAALGELRGAPPTQAQLFDQVLCLEQMLTTGGGWQDQAGGLVGGLHLVTSNAGLPQQLTVHPVTPTPEIAQALADRLTLIYTNQQRLAKNLLRAVVGRWMVRDPEMVDCLQGIGDLAIAMQTALLAGDMQQFGTLLNDHWAYNRRMDPGCTNPFIDDLFTFITPYSYGAKLAGAGGGGFIICIAHSSAARTALHHALNTRYGQAGVTVWPAAIAEAGLVVTRR